MFSTPLFLDGWYSLEELRLIGDTGDGLLAPGRPSPEARADRATVARLALYLVARVGGVAAHVEDGTFDLVRLR